MRKNPWRKMQLIIEPETVAQLRQWSGGQGSVVYRLASVAQGNLVSVSMVEDAFNSLKAILSIKINRANGYSAADRRELKSLVDDLHDLYILSWYENTAKRAGLDVDHYGYDEKDYGMSEAEEEAKVREMVRFGGKGDLSGCRCR